MNKLLIEGLENKCESVYRGKLLCIGWRRIPDSELISLVDFPLLFWSCDLKMLVSVASATRASVWSFSPHHGILKYYRTSHT